MIYSSTKLHNIQIDIGWNMLRHRSKISFITCKWNMNLPFYIIYVNIFSATCDVNMLKSIRFTYCLLYILVLHCYRLLSVFIQTAAAEAKTTNGRQECLRMASLQRPVGNSQLESFFPTCFLPHLPHPPTTFPHPPAPPPLPYFRFLPWRWK